MDHAAKRAIERECRGSKQEIGRFTNGAEAWQESKEAKTGVGVHIAYSPPLGLYSLLRGVQAPFTGTHPGPQLETRETEKRETEERDKTVEKEKPMMPGIKERRKSSLF